ncbi:hypothetical protein UCRPC4_g06819 [Phaeomoniella chlamydospora]|uniref:FAD-binding FR-type domain-containing protein n=1 Tax=Phaeomoniella chlamydospora TaxID=158046 RepID=A0A0G2DVU0_PHACM|nr:hypothetical protein UCRPC4_g06819 [Phaeomoniella chlamydospora]
MASNSQTELVSNDSYKPHVIRTAADVRQEGLHTVYVSDIKTVGDDIRIIHLKLPFDSPPIHHKAGQWLDVHIPGVQEIGGFTITSPPSAAILAPLNSHPYLELAVQKSPSNPPAAFLWRPIPEIKNAELQVRVGGNFVWPPPKLSSQEVSSIKRAVFIAGGVGINPLMSMISALSESSSWPRTVRIFYSIRLPTSSHQDPNDSNKLTVTPTRSLGSILFFTRLNSLVRDAKAWDSEGVNDIKFKLLVTGSSTTKGARLSEDMAGSLTPSLADVVYGRRIQWEEIREAIGGDNEEEKKDAVVYVCGPRDMTDEIVQGLKEKEGMGEERVLCEKWW